ncbi:hypothetical protein GCM10027187_59240 [Streptosporangium sandarakinum]
MLESALEGEITDHLGYDRHERNGGETGNTRNGSRSKTVITDVGPVEISAPRDRDGSFEPKIVRKRQRRPSGVDEMVVSLAAKGLTTGEISAHLAEVYGAEDVALAVTVDGERDILGLWAGDGGEGAKFWPQTVVQTCVVHLLRASFRYAARQIPP